MQKIIKLSEFLNSFSLPPRVKQTVQPPKENSMGSGAWICNDARESGTCWCHHRVPSASTALSRQPGGPAWPAPPHSMACRLPTSHSRSPGAASSLPTCLGTCSPGLCPSPSEPPALPVSPSVCHLPSTEFLLQPLLNQPPAHFMKCPLLHYCRVW